MSRKGDCWDNAVGESFFSTLDGETAQVRDDDQGGVQVHVQVNAQVNV